MNPAGGSEKSPKEKHLRLVADGVESGPVSDESGSIIPTSPAGYPSWGNVPAEPMQLVKQLHPSRIEADFHRISNAATESGISVLPRGLGRSYGDECVNEGGVLLSTEAAVNILSFDRDTGVLRAQAGLSIDELLRVIVPSGWFVPVTPGTRFVTLGGALANDVHGKNHHCAGTFGCHVRAFELLRSDGGRHLCTPESTGLEKELFVATIGGMGLTGLVSWIELQLIPIKSPLIAMESIRFGSLDEFFSLSSESDSSFDYTVAWLDCVSKGSRFGRGIFMRGNHDEHPDKKKWQLPSTRRALPDSSLATVPFSAPNWALNPLSVRAFNELYYRKQLRKVVACKQHFAPFFHPLDSVLHWNRIYGKRGFVQFQCALPAEGGRESITAVLERVTASGQASFLAVLKEFGDKASPGIMSFPVAGPTLCLDFPWNGAVTDTLMSDLEQMVVEAGGRLYAAKDALMSGETFRQSYPQWERFVESVDPALSSSFWRRVHGA